MNDLETRKAKAIKETADLLILYNAGIEKITEELKHSGKLKYGLDINSVAYAPLNKEFDRRMKEIFEKYNLPPGTKLNLER